MPSPFRRSLPIAGVAVLMTAALALADPSAASAPRVRTEDLQLRRALAQLISHSDTARALVERLQHSDVVVYVRYRVFAGATLDGRIGLVRSETPTRYLIIEIACARPQIEQLVTLGHELQHAVEIAEAPDVVNAAGLARHFARIGFRIGTSANADAFETRRAAETATQIRRELHERVARRTDERP